MSNLAYLGIAVVISLIGCVVLWLRTRRPRSMEHSMREFSRELDALAPGEEPSQPPSRGRHTG
ncbi:MAG: hypothetical protein DLM54_02905 [Acidimicrobiales bacterium]|nr:MAG: hypothetical protein DLM54_02905 [Acidimicrobiales bacterium]